MGNMSKIIVITGVTRGLGEVMAREFIKLGYTVWGCGRSESIIERFRKKWSGPHDFTSLDVADAAQVEKWADRLLCDGQTPDLVINNAALMNRQDNLWSISAEEFSQLIDVNIKGVANIIRSFVPKMVAKNRGIIVNFSSGWGRSVAANVAPYCTSKWAIEGLSLALAEELPSNMASIPVNPGIINTEMLEVCFGDSAANFPSPQQWAEKAIAFLLGLTHKNNGQKMTI